MKIALAVLLIAFYISAGSALKPAPGSCPGGGVGIPCRYGKQCPAGYKCTNNVCCKPLPFCASGITGPFCLSDSQCKPGYRCLGNVCCAVCPKGRKYDGRCNLKPGQQRCRFGYDCINNNLCCSSAVVGPIRVCPRVMHKTVCPQIRIKPVCFKDTDCGKGKLCCRGPCGRRYCTRGIIVPRRG